MATIYQRLKLARRGLRFDDVPRLLATGLADGLMQHTHWRLDTSIGHLLLDEFQDTSLPQWNVLKPFALACATAPAATASSAWETSSRRSIAGAAACRNCSTPSQANLPGVGEAVADQELSLQPAGDRYGQSGVCRICRPIEALADYPEVTRQWHEWFALAFDGQDRFGRLRHVVRRAARRRRQTAIASRLWSSPPSEWPSWPAECPGRSIGVLVRRNQAVAELIHLLRSKHKLPASQEGGNPLTDSAAVQLVLSLVKLADHPGDLPARFHVATSPLASSVGFANHADDAGRRGLGGPIAPAVSRRRLRPHDLWLAQTAVGLLRPARSGPADAIGRAGLRVRPPSQRSRPSDFVAFVEQTKVEDPSAAAIRVMTVHQAKGLQFDIVVAARARRPAQRNYAASWPIGRPQPIEPIERVCRHVSKAFWPLLPDEYQQMFEIWPREAVNESLCLLYVALTRAVHALHLIVPPTAENEKTFPQTFTGVLRSALVAGRKLQPESIAYEHGDRDWFQPRPGEGTCTMRCRPLRTSRKRSRCDCAVSVDTPRTACGAARRAWKGPAKCGSSGG